MRKIVLALVVPAALALTACEPRSVSPQSAKAPATSGDAAEQKPGRVDPSTVPQVVKLRAATGKTAKYSNIRAAILQPEDAKEFTSFSEYGWREAMEEYEGMGPMPAGYWVYAEPYWIVWDLRDGKRGETN